MMVLDNAKFKQQLTFLMEGLYDLMIKPVEKCSWSDIYSKEEVFESYLDNFDIISNKLGIVVSFIEDDDEKYDMEDLLKRVNKLLGYLSVNTNTWFDTKVYKIASDGQDYKTDKYELWHKVLKEVENIQGYKLHKYFYGINEGTYTVEETYNLLKEDLNIKIDEDFMNFVEGLNDDNLIQIFGKTEKEDVLDEYLEWVRTE